jgi:RNA polymerase sigma-70 factor (ECF subfamily)
VDDRPAGVRTGSAPRLAAAPISDVLKGDVLKSDVPESDEPALVAAFRGGDRRAFEVLVRRHQGPAFAVALRVSRDRSVAEDLVQRAFLRALERIDGLRGGFRPWLLRIAANLANNHLRDHAKFAEAPAEEGQAPAHDERLESERRARAVRAAIAGLPERQREVVLLRVDGQLSFAEVGEALGITANNAKVTYHHAVKRLRTLLGGHDGAL